MSRSQSNSLRCVNYESINQTLNILEHEAHFVRPTIVLYLIKALLSSFGLIIKNMYTISMFVSCTCILTLCEKYITWWVNQTFLIVLFL
jgi:hypothetical protein